MRALIAALALAATLGLPGPASADAVVPKAAWIDSMKTGLPVLFCKDGSYFRSCFQVSQEECESTASSATRVCLSKFEGSIPLQLHQPADGSSWGQKVGECAGNAFETTRADQKTNSAKCNDPSAWM